MSSVIVSPSIDGLSDIAPPIEEYLSGQYKKSFAYKTIKDRLPVIVTRIIDNMSRNKEKIIEQHGPDSAEELKQVIGSLSQMKSELMTNKPLQHLSLSNSEKDFDAAIWNDVIKNSEIETGVALTWFNSVWLLSECYMYRRIAQILSLTQTLTTYDPFQEQKQESFITSIKIISLSAKYIISLVNNENNYSSNDCKEDLIKLLKLNLWGNRCDLSLSAGEMITTDESPAERLNLYNKDILIDDSSLVCEFLSKLKEANQDITIDFVLDNSGYELITDLCVALFLVTHKFAKNIRFYVKRIPWFISDVTENDFHWTINAMKNSEYPQIQALGEKCSSYLKSGQWTIEIESFWTEPYDFAEMKIRSPSLYTKLSEAKMIIFKGDLNYRKLMGDINWEYTTNFKHSLRGFEPTNLVTLRTVKADVIVGLPTDKATELFESQPDWMTTGQYGLIQALIVDK